MMEVPRKANNLMHLEMFEDSPDDPLVHQDTLSVTSGGALIQGGGKQRQVFLFKHSLVLAKHELEGKKLKAYSTKNCVDLVSATVGVEEETCRFSVSCGSVKFWFCASSQNQKAEWVKLIQGQIDYCSKERELGSMGSNNSNEENKKGVQQKIRSSLRFHKRRKSLTKMSLKDEDIIKESEQSDWAQPYITNNRITTDDILKEKTEQNYDRCISKLSNISMSIDHINLIVPSEHPAIADPNSPPSKPLPAAPSGKISSTGYRFTDILFYGHFSLFCTCEHARTGLKFTAQVTPVIDRQFYRSVQREVDILQQLNYKRVSRLHEVRFRRILTPRFVKVVLLYLGANLFENLTICPQKLRRVQTVPRCTCNHFQVILEHENCVVLIMSYQYNLPLLDFLLLKDSPHKEHETVEVVRWGLGIYIFIL